MPHMLKAGMVLHGHHGVFRRRRASLLPFLATTTLFILLVATSTILIREVGRALVFVRATILCRRQRTISSTIDPRSRAYILEPADDILYLR